MSDTSKEAVDIKLKPLSTISGHEDPVWGVAYLPGGAQLVTCSADKTVRIWNVESGEQEGMPMEHDGEVRGLAITRDGKRIVSGGDDKVLRVWDVETQQLVAVGDGHEAGILCIVVSPESDQLLVAGGDRGGRVVISEMTGDGQLKHMCAIETGPREVSSISFSPDGTKLAFAHDDDSIIRVFDVENGNLILGPIEGQKIIVYSVVWSLDGSRLFTACGDTTLRCWDVETREAIGEPWAGHTSYVNSISLSPDGMQLASTSGDETVRYWDTDSGDPIGEPLKHEGDVWAVTFSPSGEFVACGEYGGKVSLWRVPWWDDSKEANKLLLDVRFARVLLQCPSHSCLRSSQPYQTTLRLTSIANSTIWTFP
ncbi:hypothetical protein PAXRUDRAFT_401287 [Paxillus rubicundulus Ve08.2h10]|uniref:Unplaced genomic scaffold scaffold_236, whole genome shotgun sequence n=1 Tax=Paxillus rubicundulus Ve08.2h10 TaxID=930991 RepID=A0A0D0DD56_9AGAM|nr:hypothetical protein PAXRUDRAFT_401287 [Paxillus rubicundulus Ve08.2h10]